MEPDGLKLFDLFACLDEAQRWTVAQLLEEARFPAGTRIFSEGESGDRLFLVEQGSVRISKIIHDGGEEALAILRPGSFFGEMSLVDEQPRSAEAVADSDVVAWSLSRPAFRSLIDSSSSAGTAMLEALVRTLATRLRETNDQVKAMHLMSMW